MIQSKYYSQTKKDHQKTNDNECFTEIYLKKTIDFFEFSCHNNTHFSWFHRLDES